MLPVEYCVHSIYHSFVGSLKKDSVLLWPMGKNHLQSMRKVLNYFKHNEIDVYFSGAQQDAFCRICNA